MTGYGQAETSSIGSRTDALRERLPDWARQWDSRWLIGGVVAAVILLCCCCGGGALKLGTLAGDSDDDARPTSERSSEPAPPDRTEQPSPTSDPSSSRSQPRLEEQPSVDDRPDRFTVPSTIGKNAAVAKDELQRAGFTKIRFASGDPGHRVVLLPQNWEVKSQSAPPGSTLEHDVVLVLTCTKLA